MPGPGWVDDLLGVVRSATGAHLSRHLPPPGHGRRSSVLVLFGADDGAPDAGPDVLLTQRASTLRAHAGEVSFPGGRHEPGESDTEAALRETREEVGIDPAHVHVLGSLPALYLPVTAHAVVPVVGRWHGLPPAAPVDAGEVARVERVPVAELVDPARRFVVRHPGGSTGPAFWARRLFVWGFTAGLLDRLLHLAGWERPWVPGPPVPLAVSAGVWSPDPAAALAHPHLPERQALAALSADARRARAARPDGGPTGVGRA